MFLPPPFPSSSPIPVLFLFLRSGDQTSILIPAILVPFPVAMRKYSAKHLKGEEIYSDPQVKGPLRDGEGVKVAGTRHSWSAGHVASTTGSRDGWLNVTAQLSSHFTVRRPSQGMVPPTRVGSSQLKQIKITPHRHTQRPDYQLVLDSVKLTN